MTTEAADTEAPEPAGVPAAEPRAAEPATAEPETGEPETSEPETAEPATAEPEAGGPETAEPRRRPRGRTALIMAGAVVLGVLGGGGAGYAVQSARKPTPLPPLSVAQPKYPSARAAAPVLTADQDDLVKTDGDLTALLVPAPAGTKPFADRGATHFGLDLADFAETFVNPGNAFTHQATNKFRRAAEADWYRGAESSTVYLVQYAHGMDASAASEIVDQEGFGPGATGGSAVPVPHSTSGQVFPGRKNLADAGDDAYYEGRGYAQHGDIAVEIFIDSAHPVSAQALLTLLQSQLERL